MDKTFLIITSIADDRNSVLRTFADETYKNDVGYIVIGDTKSPEDFKLEGCDFYSLKRQESLPYSLAKILPLRHYSRKNLGYLIAISKGAKKIIETDDDNFPLEDFWINRSKSVPAYLLENEGWVNVYKFFTKANIWPRGFPLEKIKNKLPELTTRNLIDCPIQQGLADENPDVDAIFRLTCSLPLTFNKFHNVALGKHTFCPFNSQNTTWFKEAFPLLYLPSFCSFRMTDIWRSFVAQRIAWTCGWPVLFHQSTVRQERNNHDLMKDFQDEIIGYTKNLEIGKCLNDLNLKEGKEHIAENMNTCYKELVRLGFVGEKELDLLHSWLEDIKS